MQRSKARCFSTQKTVAFALQPIRGAVPSKGALPGSVWQLDQNPAVYLSQYQLIPYDQARDHFADQLLIPPSAGTIHNLNRRAFGKLEAFDSWVKYQLTHSALLHVDETGINVSGKRHWLHCASNLEHD